VKIPLSYYQSNDVVSLARDLIGKTIFTNLNGHLTGGIISETEAYAGKNDKASHAYNGRRTNRNEVMYQLGGVCYIYLCYGIHNLFNIVTGEKENPQAILIRGIIPTVGCDHILARTGKSHQQQSVTNGPGRVSKALGINRLHNGHSVNGSLIWLEKQQITLNNYQLENGPRIGIDYAEEDAKLLYRFVLRKIIK